MDNHAYENELVSIITPVFNSERFVGQTIDSVIGQSFGGWELILIDDCSTDDSPGIISGYTQRDARIRYIRLDHNAGAAEARNRGLEAARGRFVAFIDADDLWMKGKLKKQIDLLKREKAGFVFTAIEMIDEEGRLVKAKRPVKQVVDYGYLLSNTIIACSSVMIDRSVTGDFRMPPVRKGQDYATWLSLLRRGIKAYGIDEALVGYRLVAGSVSSGKLGALKRTWRIYREQEHLNLARSAFHFCLYTWNAVKKYYF